MGKGLDFPLNRRRFLAGVAGAMATTSAGRAAFAATGQIVVANWGGDWNDRTVEFFEATIVEKPEKDKGPQMPPHGGGGMGDMY